MATRKHSAIWLHFEENGEGKSVCKYCRSALSIASGSLENLGRHMKRKHPFTPTVLERQVAATDPINLEANAQIFEMPTTSSYAQTQRTNIQTGISQFLRKPPPIRKVEKIDQEVLRMVAKGHHAFRIVEEPAFKNLIHLVSQCPGYNLPSRKTLSNNLLDSNYSEILEKVKLQIQCASAVCLTTDGWTSRAHSSYLAVTAHFIDNDTELKSILLSCVEFSESHSAENLAGFIRDVADNFGVGSKITAVVSDNAANVVAAIRAGQWRWIGCFAHTLNLIVQTALKEVGDIIKKVKRVVEYFHKSTRALNKLYEIQKQMDLPQLKLKQDVETRWNSTYEMLRRIDNLKDAVITTLSLTRPDLALPLEEWSVIEEILPVLRPFYEITMEISSEKNVTLSKVMVLCNILANAINQCSSKKSEVSSMVSSMKRELMSRFGDYERHYLYTESTILDPRFKRKGFKNQAAYEAALKQLTEKMCTIRLPNAEDSNATVDSTNEDTRVVDTSSIWGNFDADFSRTTRPENNRVAAIRELDKYINEEYIDRKRDPLEWWKERKNLYPRLYMHALKRLCISATSVPCERVFSATGQIINDRRTLIKPSKVSKLVFLHHNM